MYLNFEVGEEQTRRYVLKLSGKRLLVYAADIYQSEKMNTLEKNKEASWLLVKLGKARSALIWDFA